MFDWIPNCILGIALYLLIAIPFAMAICKRLHEIQKYYPEVEQHE